MIKDCLKDHCGVFGIYAPGEDVAKLAYFALFSLQHRGQEGAGIAVSNGKKINLIKNLGLVPSVFTESSLKKLKGHIAIAHNRYSTTGSNTINNVGPFIIENYLAISHNGNVINADQIFKTLPPIKLLSTTDTEIIAWAIAKSNKKNIIDKIKSVMPKFNGAYSIVLMTKDSLIAFRDPLGIRPLSVGKINGHFVFASETCAFDTIGAKYLRDVDPGEIIKIDNSGLKSYPRKSSSKKSFCLFEYVYLARPDSILNSELVHQVRQRSGEILSYEAPVSADFIMAIPDSGTSAAIGYSKASGIPFAEGLIKNRYIGRTFIAPSQRIREMGVKIKFNPMKSIVRGKRIIIVDDSIVRGTTIKKIIQILKSCGAKKVHIRVCSPPIKYPCYLGVDTPNRKELIASSLTVEKIKKYIKADSLAYLSLDGLIKAARQKENSLCTACFTGHYPLKINDNFKKTILEKNEQ